MLLYESLNHALLHHVPTDAARILDLGCGTGSLGGFLREQKEREIVGITFAEDEARIARQRLSHVIVANLDTYTPESSLGKFDAVICSHVLEHLLDPARLLRSVASHLNPGGRLLVALPNVLHWKQRLLLLRGHFKYTEGGTMDSTHLHFYDWDTAQHLVTSAGFRVTYAAAPGNLPLPIVRGFIPRAAAIQLHILATQHFPGLFGAQFIIVAEPLPPQHPPTP